MDRAGEPPSLARPGGVTYLHIPAKEPAALAAFYREVFGWRIRDEDSENPAFQDGSGDVIGHFVTDQDVAGEAGVRPYIYVGDVDTTVHEIAKRGGRVVREPFAEGALTVAVFADPAGNVLGVWRFGAPG
jgi:uncharacterized protein